MVNGNLEIAHGLNPSNISFNNESLDRDENSYKKG